MKKLISLLLILILALSLVACGEKEPDDKPDDGGDKPVAGRVGYWDDVMDDPFSRRQYHFTYMYGGADALTDNMMDCFKKLGEKYNFTVDDFCSDGDGEKFIQAIEVEANKGQDGLFLQVDNTIMDRAYEVLQECEIPFIQLFNYFPLDEDGANYVQAVVLDQYYAGKKCMEWYNERYTDYWGNVDPNEICLLIIDYSTSPPLHQRTVGAQETFESIFPKECHVEIADCVSIGKGNAEAGYNLSSQVISAHPEYTHWFVFTVTEDIAQGVARYAEVYSKPENILICCSGSNVLPLEFAAGYEGVSWKVSYAVADICYAGITVTGLLALVDGRATPETLWLDDRKPGDKVTLMIVDAIMVTKENYANFKDEEWKKYQ